MVDPHEVQDRGVQVVHGYRILSNVVAGVVRGSASRLRPGTIAPPGYTGLPGVQAQMPGRLRSAVAGAAQSTQEGFTVLDEIGLCEPRSRTRQKQKNPVRDSNPAHELLPLYTFAV
jgi:hypothetical protein